MTKDAEFESTGVYGLDLALWLAAQPGIQVRVANPRAVRHFAHALMERNKNDRVDAVVSWHRAGFRPYCRFPLAAPKEAGRGSSVKCVDFRERAK